MRTAHTTTIADDLKLDRRAALAALGAGGLALAAPAASDSRVRRAADRDYFSHAWDDEKDEYTLPPLPYRPDALEPHIDAETMRIHHGRHHAGYVRGANTALAELKEIRDGAGDASLMKHWSKQLSFHASGHINHTIFWYTMAPPGEGGGGRPTGALADAITRNFGSFDKFSSHFQAASNSVEGSGWGWLVYEPISGRLMVIQSEKQQDTTVRGVRPLLGCDVWEHAYYLQYQNRRADYVRAFMNVVNWPAVAALYNAARA